MDNLFSINVTLDQIQLLRHSLNQITISGNDAKFVAQLQFQLEHEIQEINALIENENNNKAEGLKKINSKSKTPPTE